MKKKIVAKWHTDVKVPTVPGSKYILLLLEDGNWLFLCDSLEDLIQNNYSPHPGYTTPKEICYNDPIHLLPWLDNAHFSTIKPYWTDLDITTTDPVQAAKNNDGRTTCLWCGAPTKKVTSIMAVYDVCTKCGK